MSFQEKMLEQIANSNSPIQCSELHSSFMDQQQAAMQTVFVASYDVSLSVSVNLVLILSILQFEAKKLGNEEASTNCRDKLDRDLNNFYSTLIGVSEAYNKYLNVYVDSMKKSIDETRSFLDQGDLIKMHQQTRKEILAEV